MTKTLVAMLTLTTLLIIAFSPILAPLASRMVPTSDEGECRECHGSFVAFELEGSYPEVLPIKDDQTVSLKVRNTGKHDITLSSAAIDITDASFLSFTNVEYKNIPLSMDGAVTRGVTAEHEFDVPSSSVSIEVRLLYDPRTVDLTDLDLSVKGPDGTVWAASESDDEVVEIGKDDIVNAGAGQFTALITHARGLRSASYNLEMVIVTGPERKVVQDGPPIQPGKSHIFEWTVMASSQGSGSIGFEVSANVHHDHEGDEQDDALYRLDGIWAVRTGEEVKQSNFQTSAVSVDSGWIMGRVFAFVAVVSFLISALLGGTVKPLKRMLDIVLSTSNRKGIHCIVSFISVLSVALHVLFLYTGRYYGSTDGLLLGGTALVGMIGLAFTGSFQGPVSRKIGGKRWRMLHLGLTILVLVVFMVHALMEGTEFAFLR